uniref:ORF31 n=1 Tax=Nitrosopumilaceae spindle-shaped virus TaxID=3065433 RepID=A0AAT9JAN7_9VIRU
MNESQGKIVMLVCVGLGISILLGGQYFFHKETQSCHNVNDPCFQSSVNIGMISIFGAIFAWASIPFTMLFTDTNAQRSRS